MTWLLTILLMLLPLVCKAPPVPVCFYKVPGVTATPNITVDMWQSLEFDPPISTANLASTDHASGSWTLSDTGSKWGQTAQQNLLCTINNTSSGGFCGYGMDYNGTAKCLIQYNPPSSYTSTAVSHVMALFVPTLGANRTVEVAYSSNVVHVIVNKTGGTYVIRLNSTAGDSSNITITDNTWYYVTWLAQKNATCKLRVYDLAGVQVGSEVTITGNNSDYTNPIWGEPNTHTATTGIFLYDNMCLDKTSAVFPLGVGF